MTVQAELPPTGAGLGLSDALGQGLDTGSEILPARTPDLGRASRLPLSAWAWALFQGARDPYVVIISIYIFAPYFATTVVGDPVKGQALVAQISTIYGLIVCVAAPLLAAMVNRLGPRKPWLAVVVGVMAPLTFALWWVHPGPGGISVLAASLMLGVIASALVMSDVLHNALLSIVVDARQAPVASGLAYSLVNLLSTSILVFVLWAFVLPGKVAWPIIPAHPLFGLDPLLHEPERIVGPITAVLMVVGAAPLFLFCRDAPATGVKLRRALSEGVRELGATAALLKGERNLAIYLGARMLYTDAKTALLAFGGLYAKGVMGWHVLEMLAYGILLSIFAVLGGFVGAALDLAVGPRRAVMIEVAGSLICLTLATGLSPHVLFYVFPYEAANHPPLWNGPMFRTLPEVLYLGIGFGTAIFVTAAYSSSRTLLTRLAPPDKIGSFFGLYALSGTATMWLGALLVGVFTALLHTQQSGFLAIGGLLILGLAGMSFVRGGDPLPKGAAEATSAV